MKPFFSPLVRERVNTLFSRRADIKMINQYIAYYCEEFEHFYNTSTDIKENKVPLHEVCYLVYVALEDVATIQSCTTLHQTHAAHILDSIGTKMAYYVDYTNLEHEKYIQIATHIVVHFLCIAYPEMHHGFVKLLSFLEDYNALPTTPSFSKKIIVPEQAFKTQLLGYINNAMDIYTRISTEIDRYIDEDFAVYQIKAAEKKTQKISWDTIIDAINSKTPNLDSLYFFLSSLANNHIKVPQTLAKINKELLDKINASRPEGVININVEGDNNGEINGIKQTYNK